MLNTKAFKFMRSLKVPIIKPTRIGFLFIACFLMLASSASARGVYHTVKKGETLWRICHTYEVSTKEVSRINRIKNTEKIRVGQKIYIPGRTKIRRVSYSPGSPANSARSSTKNKRKLSKIERGRFGWPVSGKVISSFGVEGGTSQDGIDIKARKGSPVKASDGGEVVHVTDGMRVFGNVIILKHKGDFYTLYAHNDTNLVKTGDRVKKGDKIAKVGNTGDAGSYKLHFELRDGRDVRNPILFLP